MSIRSVTRRGRAALFGAITLSIVLAPVIVHARAQTPADLRNLKQDLGAGGRAIAGSNPWFGAQLSQRFGGDKSDFASELVASGLFTYNIDVGTTDFKLPVITNFGGKFAAPSNVASAADGMEQQMKELAQSTVGLSAGVFPYYIAHSSTYVMATLHGLVTWRYNSLRPYGDSAAKVGSASANTTPAPAATGSAPASDASQNVDLQSFKLGLGGEVVIGDRTKPALTFGVTPVMRVFLDPDAYQRAFGERRRTLMALEITSILPIQSAPVGLLFEGVYGPSNQSSFRVGILTAAKP